MIPIDIKFHINTWIKKGHLNFEMARLQLNSYTYFPSSFVTSITWLGVKAEL